jgi:hypothetical protein
MNEPYPGGPGGHRQPDQPDPWTFDDWYRSQDGKERESGPREVSGELGGGRHYRGRRRPELSLTTVDQITAVDAAVVDQTSALAPPGRRAGQNWLPANLSWALISRNWALIVGLVFFLFDTFLMADGFASPVAMASRVLVIFIWLISLVAVALLWLRGSSRFSIQNPLVRTKTEAQRPQS